MSRTPRISAKAMGLLITSAFISAALPTVALADDTTSEATFTRIAQNQMSVVWSNSAVAENEGANGPLDKMLDGDKNSYWHTKWSSPAAPLPHNFIVKLGDSPVKLAKVVLTPRQSSNGSGRANEWELYTSTDGTCDENSTFTLAQRGSFPGDTATYASDREIHIKPSVETNCVKFTQLSSWGGHNPGQETSQPETVGSLAEFNAFTGEWPADPANPPTNPGDNNPTDPDPAVPEERLFTLSAGNLNVKMFKNFPQVYEWKLGEAKAPGMTSEPVALVTVNEVPKQVKVSEATVAADNASASWDIAVIDTQIRFKAVATVANGVWKLQLTDLQDPENALNRISFPGLSLVTLGENEELATARLSVNRAQSGDKIAPAKGYARLTRSYMSVPTAGQLSFGMDNNAIVDNTQNYSEAGMGSNNRWLNIFLDGKGKVIPGPFVWKSPVASGIGADKDPYIVVKPTVDANNDGALNWQDGAIAMRDIRPAMNGSEMVKDTVITRIPFNIVSQATHPFLRTLDDTKRISLATDGLRQQVMLKGYQAEGHDSAHPDYAGHYNERAGGYADLVTLAKESEKWNATLGVHVNVTESYSESKNFSEDLLRMPPRKAWGWMNQAYSIDGPKDLGTGKVLERFQQFKDEAPANLNWLYIDVYYPDGWEGRRLGEELTKQGWVIGSEWSNKFPENSIWSHWANDENYGGQANKGINSQIFRFVENTRRDVFNPHPILSNSNVVEFEGWTGNIDFRKFIMNVWNRNLPVKFLQQSEIMKWDAHRIEFANGTVATSNLDTISGRDIPYDRTITFDNAVVYEGGKYLLPWKDGGKDRLYHWNIASGTSTWTLTDAWRNQTSLDMYKLTDTGRVKVGTVPVTNGQVTLEADSGVAYVLYPTSSVLEPKVPNWGQGSKIVDPGFFSGTLDAYQVTGEAHVVKTKFQNFQAELGAGPASISQSFEGGNLPAGTYNASAWIEIDPGKEREVSLSVSGAGVKPTQLQKAVDGVPTTTFNTSLTVNKTASDEKLGTYFQRARVTFSTTGGKVDFKIAAGEGDARVSIDDLRIVPFVEPKLPAGVDASKVISFDNYEHPDAGYWPFVTGPDQRGDARTQLTELHAPYSQAGWWAIDPQGNPREGYKLVDNVLEGNWSLMAHEENQGVILKTAETTVQFKPNHKYRITFDYQNAIDDSYAFVTGYNAVRNGQLYTDKKQVHVFKSTADATTLPAKGHTKKFEHVFDVGACGSYWFGIEKLTRPFQADLVMDNIMIEDLGVSENPPACARIDARAADGSLVAGKTNVVSTTVTSNEKTEANVLYHKMLAPEGWSVVALEAADTTLPPQETSTQHWLVTPPASAAGTTGDLQVSAAYTLSDGATRLLENLVQVKVNTDGLVDGKNYLSDLPFVSSTNGWGPVERDTNNGENQAGDGGKISIDGVTYDKGLGTHANSQIRIKLDAKCTQFHAVVGVDDRQATAGSVRFSVSGDNRVLVPTTEVLRANSPAKVLEADVTGVNELVLNVDNGGDGFGNDWASWGDAHVMCSVAAKEAPATLSITPEKVKAGEEITLSLGGFTPGDAPVSLRYALSAKEIGSVEVSAEGTATFKYTVPADTKETELIFGAVQAVGEEWKAASAKVTVEPAKDVKPDPDPSNPGTDPSNPGTDPSNPGTDPSKPVVEPKVSLLTLEVTAGEAILGVGSGFTPNSEVAVELHSKVVALGTVTSDAAGKVAFNFKTPATVPAGQHHVVLVDKATGKSVKAAVLIKPVKSVKPVKPVKPVNPKVPPKKTLPITGASSAGVALGALVLGLSGAALVRRRKGQAN
ncbi:endo-alpha-N-acetylgalactosaminidase family protein [Gleimia sp. 6138-11-ORH1]|uniref:endo-alpha-N-acetylgalactosaminidase family protein n=1 Tax=Gleimia sp. 6138-11-ORH1 TaxID=2973937 RepID=UPI002168476D|nr:endo-alpha-N-acetylgalactosaminidase family protein [Gleimia sp. 6138-11-ORH1]MCS4483942.1 endo-alpha-N-acetylgalactosaminidase family protein [Gleimia sp. 6138-11-ORH1]